MSATREDNTIKGGRKEGGDERRRGSQDKVPDGTAGQLRVVARLGLLEHRRPVALEGAAEAAHRGEERAVPLTSGGARGGADGGTGESGLHGV